MASGYAPVSSSSHSAVPSPDQLVRSVASGTRPRPDASYPNTGPSRNDSTGPATTETPATAVSTGVESRVNGSATRKYTAKKARMTRIPGHNEASHSTEYGQDGAPDQQRTPALRPAAGLLRRVLAALGEDQGEAGEEREERRGAAVGRDEHVTGALGLRAGADVHGEHAEDGESAHGVDPGQPAGTAAAARTLVRSHARCLARAVPHARSPARRRARSRGCVRGRPRVPHASHTARSSPAAYGRRGPRRRRPGPPVPVRSTAFRRWPPGARAGSASHGGVSPRSGDVVGPAVFRAASPPREGIKDRITR